MLKHIRSIIIGIAWGLIYSFMFFGIDHEMIIFFVLLFLVICFVSSFLIWSNGKTMQRLTIARLLVIICSGFVAGIIGGLFASLSIIKSGILGALYSLIFVIIIYFALFLVKNKNIIIKFIVVSFSLLLTSYLSVVIFALLFLQDVSFFNILKFNP